LIGGLTTAIPDLKFLMKELEPKAAAVSAAAHTSRSNNELCEGEQRSLDWGPPFDRELSTESSYRLSRGVEAHRGAEGRRSHASGSSNRERREGTCRPTRPPVPRARNPVSTCVSPLVANAALHRDQVQVDAFRLHLTVTQRLVVCSIEMKGLHDLCVRRGDPCGRPPSRVRGEAGGHKARPYEPIPFY
jgi:hypothetical protein